MADDIFCKILRREIPSTLLYQDDLVVAFRDIAPKAPVHILIVPKEHIPSIADVGPAHAEVLLRMVEVANRLAKQEGIAESGYRLVTNVGPNSGQEVAHLHCHLLGGTKLSGL